MFAMYIEHLQPPGRADFQPHTVEEKQSSFTGGYLVGSRLSISMPLTVKYCWQAWTFDEAGFPSMHSCRANSVAGLPPTAPAATDRTLFALAAGVVTA